MKDSIRVNLSPGARRAWDAFTDEHDQHAGYRPNDAGAICHGSSETHPDESPRFDATALAAAADALDTEPAPRPGVIPLTFELDLNRWLGEWQAPHGVGPDGEGASAHPMTLEDVVIRVAGTTLADRVDRSALSELTQEARKTARTVQNEVIRDLFVERVNAMLDGPMQQTDRYGNAVGEPTTLRAVVTAGVERTLTDQVTDPWGKERRGSSFAGNEAKATIIEWAIAALVKAEVTTAVKEAVDAAKADVVAAVQAEGAKVLTEAVGKVLGAKVG